MTYHYNALILGIPWKSKGLEKKEIFLVLGNLMLGFSAEFGIAKILFLKMHVATGNIKVIELLKYEENLFNKADACCQ